MRQYTEKEREYDRYMLRVEYLREQATLREDRDLVYAELKETKAKLEQAKASLKVNKKKLVLIEKNELLSEALLEIESLKQQLQKKTMI